MKRSIEVCVYGCYAYNWVYVRTYLRTCVRECLPQLFGRACYMLAAFLVALQGAGCCNLCMVGMGLEQSSAYVHTQSMCLPSCSGVPVTYFVFPNLVFVPVHAPSLHRGTPLSTAVAGFTHMTGNDQIAGHMLCPH